eukprot:5182882-Lingulodinium_polyedra.AAC.1
MQHATFGSFHSYTGCKARAELALHSKHVPARCLGSHTASTSCLYLCSHSRLLHSAHRGLYNLSKRDHEQNVFLQHQHVHRMAVEAVHPHTGLAG